MNSAEISSLYVRLPEESRGYANLTTFGTDFFGWPDRSCDLKSDISQLTRYIETCGQPKALEVVSALLREEPSDLIITDSASQSLAISFAYARMNDLHCWIPRPWFPAYRTLPQIFGCKFSTYDPFDEEQTVELFKALSSDPQSLIIVNTPSNPLGKGIPATVADAARLASAAATCQVVRDLSYYWVLEPRDERRAGGIRVYSLGKALGLPGMRLGAVVCEDQTLKREIEAIKRQMALHSCPLSETAACRVIEYFDIPALQSLWRQKLSNRSSEYLAAVSGCTEDPPVGPFLVESYQVVSRANAVGVSGEAFGLTASETRICLASPKRDWSGFLDKVSEAELMQ